MGVKIGNNNTIKNSNIAETVNGCSANGSDCKKKFYESHPVICSFLISLIDSIIFDIFAFFLFSLIFSFYINIAF